MTERFARGSIYSLLRRSGRLRADYISETFNRPGPSLSKKTISRLFIIVIANLIVSGAALAGAKEFRIIKSEVNLDMEKNTNRDSHLDYYINGGEDDGLTASMILDVFRATKITDHKEDKTYEIRTPVGKVRIIYLTNTLSIARVHSIESSPDTPVLVQRAVMTGDYVVPPKDSLTSTSAKIDPVVEMTGSTVMPAATEITATPAVTEPPVAENISLISTNIESKVEQTPSDTDTAKVSKNEDAPLPEQISLPSATLFRSNRWQLTSDGIKLLSKSYDKLSKSDKYKIFIEGHTDNIGSKKYNIRLSERRAQSVANFFIKKKRIPKAMVTIQGFGSGKPIASNDTKEGREKNRRVVIRFEGK